ncbi:MAG TPA: 16S rRNA (adenine(1518)-N(6)/adenine(1519)-N(6))-dimethyltransferase RsmA [Candidatus Binatia bacterium]|nr:16S rRNA (adenine(1518)-N(6)/adenine(1519)-N(6))-dimethyltransferase RsmA [Candidatus Binatia bacterium]
MSEDGAALLARDGLPPLREVIRRHGLEARRALGQNFLFDLNLTAKIARAAGKIDEGTVIEIGPGPGGLTRALLLEGARKVIAVERDARALPALTEVSAAYPGRLEVIEGDALSVDAGMLGEAPRRIVANLPYNIATPLLLKWLEQATRFVSLTLMFQKEVADRLVARPRTEDYGRLSIVTQWRCEAKRLFDIPPRAFTPPPKVTSTVVQLIPRAEPAFPADPKDLEAVAEAGFGQRRKMLRQSLKSLPVEVNALLDRANIRDTARAEELSIEEFSALARALAELRRRGRSG